MTLTELVTAVILKATGKVTSLATTDAKYIKVKNIANFYISSWQNTPNVDWSSLYEPAHSIGVVSATDTFTLDATIRKLSDTRGDYVRLGSGTDITNAYQIVPADTLQRYAPTDHVCAQIGRNLVFRAGFGSDSQFIGETIYVPVYTFAENLSDESDVVPVDIPEWLVVIVAAEYVRNDPTKQNQYPNLIQEANLILQRMIDDNDAQVSEAFVAFSANGRSW